MANVTNTITLQDKMTPVLRQIIRSMDSTIKAMKALNAESKNMASANALKQADNAILAAKNNLDNLGNSMKSVKAGGEQIKAGFAAWKGPLVAAAAAIAGIKVALGIVTRGLAVLDKFNQEAYVEDFTQSRLASQLRNVVRTREEGMKAQREINRLADEGELRTVVAGSATVAGASQLATLGIKPEEIQKLIPTMRDLAVGIYGVNVNEEQLIQTAQLMGRAFNGQAGALSRYGITMTDAQKKILETGTQAQKTAAMIELLGGSFGGLAENMTKSMSGVRQQFLNLWGKMFETVGKSSAAAFGELYKSIMRELPRITAMVQQLMDMVIPAIMWLANTGVPMAVDVLSLILPIVTGIYNFIANNWPTIRKVISIVTLGLSDFVLKLIDLWNWNEQAGGGIIKAWWKIKDGIIDAISKVKVFVMQAFQNMINFAIDQFNTLISYVNKIPGVDIAQLEHANFGDKVAAEEAIKAATRQKERATRDAQLAAKYADRQAARDRDASTFGVSGAEAIWGGFKGKLNIGSVDQIKGSVKLDDEDIRLMRDVAMKEFEVKYQQVLPSVNISNMNVSQKADVNEVAAELEKMVANAANSDNNVGIVYGN